MPYPSNSVDDLSEGFKNKIKVACERNKVFRFTVYDKQYRDEVSKVGQGIRAIKLDPLDFDRDPVKMAEEVVRIRIEARLRNKNYNKKDSSVSESSEESIEKPILKGLAKYGITQLTDINLYLPKTGASTVASIGSSQTGKSTLLRHVANKYYLNNKYINFLYTVSSNIDLYKDSNPHWIIRNGFGKADEMMIEMQKNINFNLDNKYKFVNFFDDIIDNKYSKTIDKLCLVYRNQLISTWLSTQYPYLISKKNRANINSIILFRFHQCSFVEEVIKTYLRPYLLKIMGNKATLEDMVDFYMEATKDHAFIYMVPFEDRIDFIKLSL